MGLITILQWQCVTFKQQAGCVLRVYASEFVSHGDGIHWLLPQGKSGKAYVNYRMPSQLQFLKNKKAALMGRQVQLKNSFRFLFFFFLDK